MYIEPFITDALGNQVTLDEDVYVWLRHASGNIPSKWIRCKAKNYYLYVFFVVARVVKDSVSMDDWILYIAYPPRVEFDVPTLVHSDGTIQTEWAVMFPGSFLPILVTEEFKALWHLSQP